MSCYLSSLFKSEDSEGYASRANSGMMLGYPVSIGGQSHNPVNNIGYHATIKVFNRDKDHGHAVHNLAQHLPLNPPDAKNTQIEPTTFKDRNGNDIYVIKLHGNSAEKIKEHNGKFAHMGDHVPYEFAPHISVDKDTHDRIKNSGAKTAHEAGISFGNAELKRGPKTIKTYHHQADTTEPRVPDESDFTAKIPYEPQMKKLESSEKNNLCDLHKSENISEPGSYGNVKPHVGHAEMKKQPFGFHDKQRKLHTEHAKNAQDKGNQDLANKHSKMAQMHDSYNTAEYFGPHSKGRNEDYSDIREGRKTWTDKAKKLHTELSKSELDFCSLHKSESVSGDNSNDEDAHALLNRKEDKYFLPRRHLETVVSELSDRFALGDIDTDTRYCRNRTVYLDDKDLSSMRDVVSKKTPRTKVRIRQYNPNNNGWEQVAYAEFKIKEEDGQSKKIRVRIPASFVDELADGGRIFFNEHLININRDIDRRILESRIQAINNAISRRGLRKQIEVQYERRAYSGKNLRITIDDDLNFFNARPIDPTVKDSMDKEEGWSKFIKPYLFAAWENPLILEVKSGESVPGWLKKLLKDVEAEETRFSKYAAAMVTHIKNNANDGKILNVYEEMPAEMNKSEDLNQLQKSENDQSSKPSVQINPEHGKTIANAYENMKHDPNHPEVKAAYGALANETNQQFKNILGSGLKISSIKPGQENPYKNSKEMHHDVQQNKHLWYFPTDQGFGAEAGPKDHPMLAPSGFSHENKPLLANDVFRIVHDINGHHAGGQSGFGPTGEHQAYLTHKKMYSPLANKALFSETAGQNNWVNFSDKYGESNRKDPKNTKFAEQKAGLMPDNIINGKWHNET